MSNVVGIGNAAIDPDNVLEIAKGNYESVIVLGYDKDGYLDGRASTNLTRENILWLLEQFKHKYVLNMSNEVV
ncbi:hypothetical protein [Vibrio cholerae]|uniref:hypothetical protein n=1 Tax=Vibrio cholerae TaxID=666 RepID=UPI00053C6DC3|nr:hypothetical protein [Vibrio cholerae]